MATSTTPDKPLLFAFRAEDSEHGVTRATVQRMAQIKGLSETALIHLALANLARTTLPWYEPDDGPLTEEQLAAIRADVAKHAPGQWALIPWFAKERALKYSTNNARSEELLSKASYKDPWKRGQRCIIPATTFDEP